jgi:hypothetical protein
MMKIVYNDSAIDVYLTRGVEGSRPDLWFIAWAIGARPCHLTAAEAREFARLLVEAADDAEAN